MCKKFSTSLGHLAKNLANIFKKTGYNINEKGVFITMYNTVYFSMYGTMSDKKERKKYV